MKTHSFLLSILLSTSAIQLHAISINTNFGKISDEEINLTQYDPDTTAEALILYEHTDVHFIYSAQAGFELVTDFSTRIKILKDEGVSQANITIPYYFIGYEQEEKVTKLQGFVYNRVNGKIVKTKLDKDYIFDEQISENTKQKKFTFPNVKQGSIIEYKYSLQSDFYYNIPPIIAQRNIPILHLETTVTIPEYFQYNTNITGWTLPNINQSLGNQNFNIIIGSYHEMVSASTQIYKLTTDSVEALKEENYIFCLEDYRPKLTFELRGINMPNSIYQPYTNSWPDLEARLMEFKEFGGALKMTCPFKNEIEQLKAIADPNEKIQAVLDLVRAHMTWNGNYGIFAEDIKKAVQNGKGDMPQINFTLISALREAGLEAYPVVFSRRSKGRIPLTFPTIDKLNSLIAAVKIDEGNLVYLDACSPVSTINIFNPNLLVENARLITERGSQWVDLSNLSRNLQNLNIEGTIGADGLITGEARNIFLGECAYDYQILTAPFTEAEQFRETAERAYEVEVQEYQQESPQAGRVNENFTFTKQSNTNGDYIYIDPFVLSYMSKNPFPNAERKYPVEFDYNRSDAIMAKLTIPDGYTIVEAPQNIALLSPDKSLKCVYHITIEGNTISLLYKFDRKRSFFDQPGYGDLRAFYANIVGKKGEQIVLKRTLAQ